MSLRMGLSSENSLMSPSFRSSALSPIKYFWNKAATRGVLEEYSTAKKHRPRFRFGQYENAVSCDLTSTQGWAIRIFSTRPMPLWIVSSSEVTFCACFRKRSIRRMRKTQFQCFSLISFERIPCVRLSSKGKEVHFWAIKLDRLIYFFMIARVLFCSSVRFSP